MKKSKFKLILALILIGLLVSSVLISLFRSKKEKGSDYKIGILANDGIAMVTISPGRQMINFLGLSDDSQVWIPTGMGWYRNQVLKRILVQEKKTDLVKDILFYNFGFVADKVVVLNKTSDWQNKFWWLLLRHNTLISKTDRMVGDTDKHEAFLDKIMVRDFSETKVGSDDLKISVINLSDSDGLANFITKRLERSGFSVVSINSGDGEKIEKCKILYGEGVEKTFSWQIVKKIFECDLLKDSSLNEGEVEIYLDEKFSEVIKYPSYKK